MLILFWVTFLIWPNSSLAGTGFLNSFHLPYHMLIFLFYEQICFNELSNHIIKTKFFEKLTRKNAVHTPCEIWKHSFIYCAPDSTGISTKNINPIKKLKKKLKRNRKSNKFRKLITGLRLPKLREKERFLTCKLDG